MSKTNPDDPPQPEDPRRKEAIEALTNDWKSALDEYYNSPLKGEEKANHVQRILEPLRHRADELGVEYHVIADAAAALRRKREK